jgi:hypothetical protein
MMPRLSLQLRPCRVEFVTPGRLGRTQAQAQFICAQQ